MTKHTQGPWAARANPEPDGDKWPYWVDGSGGEPIANVFGYEDGAEVAALIARAPDLLAENERLRAAARALDRMSRGVDWCDEDEQARRWAQLRAALAATEGEKG